MTKYKFPPFKPKAPPSSSSFRPKAPPSGFGAAGLRTPQQTAAALVAYRQRLLDLPRSIIVFTDGACRRNPGPAGSGVWLQIPERARLPVATHPVAAAAAGATPPTGGLLSVATATAVCSGWEGRRRLGPATNNIAEIEALRLACDLLQRPSVRDSIAWAHIESVEVFSDSHYTVEIANGRQRFKSNADRWVATLNELKAVRVALSCPLRVQWIPAHCGLDGNERADQLANEGLLLPALGTTEVYDQIRATMVETTVGGGAAPRHGTTTVGGGLLYDEYGRPAALARTTPQ
jgi:ribonuclease HI